MIFFKRKCECCNKKSKLLHLSVNSKRKLCAECFVYDHLSNLHHKDINKFEVIDFKIDEINDMYSIDIEKLHLVKNVSNGETRLVNEYELKSMKNINMIVDTRLN